jgi:hypothetical protein
MAKIHDDNVVLITATGNCGIVKKIFSEREVALRQSLDNSRKVRRSHILSLFPSEVMRSLSVF